MYRFKTKDGQYARVEPNAVRGIVPHGNRTGYVKLVLDGGHAVTVEGETETVYGILNQYRLTPTPHGRSAEAQASTELREATDELRSARLDAQHAALLAQMPPELDHQE